MIYKHKKINLLLFLTIFIFLLSINCTPESSGGDEGSGSNINTTTTTIVNYPTFSPIGGFYKEAQTVTIAHKDSADIYYTTDETEPTELSTKYNGPITVNTQCVIRAMALLADGTKRYAMTAFDFDLDRATDYSGTAIASPNWQDQIIYFLMTDRFYNGDTANDNDGDSFDETLVLPGQVESGYNGGDLKGIEAKLDYIKNLGATAVWLTPPIKNQVSEGNYHGFHGYWASDFTKVDFHAGTLADYQSLVNSAHDKNMYIIQDIVVNHVGDYMKIGRPITAAMLKNKPLSTSVFEQTPNSVPYKYPEQLPWKMNDPNLYTVDELTNSSFYNWNPKIANFTDKNQTLTYQMSDLDDIKTTNNVVRNLLRGYFRYWIDKAGIDGYRIDTVMYVEPDFFEDFINGTETKNKGVREYAKDVGKNDFISFGEAWTDSDTINASYTKSGSKKRIDGAIYFPLNIALRDVFGGGRPTSNISNVLNQRYTVGYDNPDKLITFVDNHDMERLLKDTDEKMVKAAYAIIMTIPGVPQIYYGVEQGFDVGRRQAMFAGGYDGLMGTNATDLFTESGNWYDFFKDIIALRKNNRVFRYNQLDIVKDSGSAGLFSYKITEKDSSGALEKGIDKEALIIANTSESDKFLSINSGFEAGDKISILQPSTAGFPSDIVVQNGGSINVLIPAKGYGIYMLKAKGETVDIDKELINITSSYPTQIEAYDFTIDGTVDTSITLPKNIKIVLNDNFNSAVTESITATPFSITYDLSSCTNGINTITLLMDNGGGVYASSNTVSFSYVRPYVKIATITDPENDDTGPSGHTYALPTDTTFKGQMDITKVEVYQSGTSLRLDISTRTMSKVWNPTTNMFDHVMFGIFFQKPGSSTGCALYPKHNYTLPDSFKWDYLLKMEGWSSFAYSSVGASATDNGTPVSVAPTSKVDWTGVTTGEKTPGLIQIFVSPESLGSPSSLDGWKIYINTYDADSGQLRGMVTTAPEQWKFSGGDMATDPLVIDETDIITVN